MDEVDSLSSFDACTGATKGYVSLPFVAHTATTLTFSSVNTRWFRNKLRVTCIQALCPDLSHPPISRRLRLLIAHRINIIMPTFLVSSQYILSQVKSHETFIMKHLNILLFREGELSDSALTTSSPVELGMHVAEITRLLSLATLILCLSASNCTGVPTQKDVAPLATHLEGRKSCCYGELPCALDNPVDFVRLRACRKTPWMVCEVQPVHETPPGYPSCCIGKFIRSPAYSNVLRSTITTQPIIIMIFMIPAAF